METPENAPPETWRRRPRLQLSVRAMLLLVLVTGGGLGWLTHRARVQRDAVAAIQAAGGQVFYDWDVKFVPGRRFQTTPQLIKNGRPKWPAWLVGRLGVDYFGDVRMVYMGPKGTDAVMTHVGRLGRLTHLSFLHGGDPLSDAGLAHLRALDELSSIVFSPNAKVTRAGLENLKSLPRLERLIFYDLPLTDDDLVPLGQLTGLVSLHNDNPRITDAGLGHLSGLVNMRDLNLSRTQITGAGLSHLRAMTGLTYLTLNQTRVDTLEPIRHLSRLTNLVLIDTPIDDAGLAPVAGFAALERLSLANTRVGDAGLGHVRGLAGLTQLFLDGTRVTDTGLVHLAKLPRLEVLGLRETGVTGPGLRHLAGLPALKSLLLGGTVVDDAALAHLAGLTSLVSLDLSDTCVTDAGLARLVGQQSLVVLLLRGTKVTDAGVAAFNQARPETKLDQSRAPARGARRPHLISPSG